jgi:hypothetical protein
VAVFKEGSSVKGALYASVLVAAERKLLGAVIAQAATHFDHHVLALGTVCKGDIRSQWRIGNCDVYLSGVMGRVSPIFIKFLIKNPANFLVALLSGILPFACPLT